MAGWDIRRIYLYLVSFATLMMLIIGTVQIINALVDFAVPPPKAYPLKIERVKELSNNTKLTKEEIEKQAAEEEARQEADQRHWRIKRLIESLALVAVALPTYLYHWRKIQKAEAQT